MSKEETADSMVGRGAPIWGAFDVMLAAAACLLLFPALGSRSLWHSEGRWAEITREMFLTGDYFHPTIGGEPYFDKPVLTYWLVAAVSALLGRLDEWATRLPSAISGVVGVAATWWLGRHLWSLQVGRIAAAILVTTFGFLFWSRTAAADTENLAAIMLAIAWYWSRGDRPSFGAFLGFYVIVFVGALTKGLPAVLVPVLAILPDVVMRRRWLAVLTPGHLAAALLGFCVYLAPFVYASLAGTGSYSANGLALVFRENIVRFFRPFDHTGPIYLYVYYLPVLLMPWAPLFIAAIVGLPGEWKSLDARTKWLFWAMAVIFCFFTASGSRRGYYILPLLPFAALTIGVFLCRSGSARLESARRHGLRVQLGVTGVVVFLELVGPLIGAISQAKWQVPVPRALYIALPAIGLGALAVGYVLWRFVRVPVLPRLRLFLGMAGATAIVMAGFFCWQQNLLEVFRTERPFALALKAEAAGLPPEDIGLFRNNSASLLFYLDAKRPLPVLRNADELRAFVSGGTKRVVVTRRKFIADAYAAAPDNLSETADLAEPAPVWVAQEADDDLVAWFVGPWKHEGVLSGERLGERNER